MFRFLALIGVFCLQGSQAFTPTGRRISSTQRFSATSDAADYLSPSSLDLTGGSVLVSGFLDDSERDDQFVFDVLHTPKSWKKIVAFSSDSATAKKRLISRSARYTGLLDVLDFVEGTTDDSTKMKDNLNGMDAWLNFNANADSLAANADAAIAAGVKYMVSAFVVPEGSSVPDLTPVTSKLEAAGVEYAFVASAPVVEGVETGFVRLENATAGSIPAGASICRDDLVRVVGELAGEPGLAGACVASFAPVADDDTTSAYLRSLREKGISRAEELGAMVRGGLIEYEAIEAERIANETAAAEAKANEKIIPITDESRAEERRRLRLENLRQEQAEFSAEVKRRAEKKLDLEWANIKWKSGSAMIERDYRELNWDRACKLAMKEMYSILRWQGTLEEALGTEDVIGKLGEIPGPIESYPTVEGEGAADAGEGASDVTGESA